MEGLGHEGCFAERVVMTVWASESETLARFRAETFDTFDFRVYDVWDNEEFLTGAKVDLIERGRVVETKTFVGSSEFAEAYLLEGSASAQASSYAMAWVEAMSFSFEERLGPYGMEWEREAMDRFEVARRL